MNQIQKEAFLQGYLHKTAGPLDTFLETARGGTAAGWQAVQSIAPILMALPVAAGIGTGALHSKLTSPTPTDQEATQKALEVAEQEEFATELERRRAQAQAEAREKEQGGRGERALHI